MYGDLTLVLQFIFNMLDQIFNLYVTIGLFAFALAIYIFNKVVNVIRMVQGKK